jgi:hypothetical protein
MDKIRYQIKIKDGKKVEEEIHKVVVHRFIVDNLNDSKLYEADIIWHWEQTDAGKFIIENTVSKLCYHQYLDHMSYSYKYVIVAELEKKKLSEFYLRWSNQWK